jgi:hypothetical protein
VKIFGNYSRKKSNPTLSFGLATYMILGIFALVFYFSGDVTGETEVVFSDDSFEIIASYGRSFSYGDVTAAELRDDMPKIGRKNNGAGLGKIRKGYFVVEGLGECLLFIETDVGPYFYIEAGRDKVFINHKDSARTIQLYEDFMVHWDP